MMTQAEALTQAALQFRSYEKQHREKAHGALPHENGLRRAKAEVNQKMAEMCEEVVGAAPYQVRVRDWMLECFNEQVAADMVERGDRFLEEVFELLQATGYDFDRIDQLKSYVAGRPAGEVRQEVGGVAVCLFALCNAAKVNVGEAAEAELARISEPTMMAKIHAKWAAKPSMSPLPQ